MKTDWKNIAVIERYCTFLIAARFCYAAEASKFVFRKRYRLSAPIYEPALY